MTGKRTVLGGFITLVVLLAGAGVASAKKPVPPPPPEPVDSGVVYYGQDPVYSVLPDGTENGLVTTGLPTWSPPSQLTHGGKRWFLRLAPVAGETYPDGRRRLEVFAVSDAGDWKQVTNAPNIQPLDPSQPLVDPANPGAADVWSQWFTSLSWALGDTRISYAGREWSNGTVIEGGIYYADLTADIAQLASPVTPACVAVPLNYDNTVYGPRVLIRHQAVSWAPYGSALVYVTIDGIFTADLTSGTPVQIGSSTLNTQCVRWSPTGLRIMYVDQAGILSMATDGSDLDVIVPPDRKGFSDQPTFSPTGSHIVFRRRDAKKGTNSLRVATAEGESVTTILDPVAASPSPYWVGD